MTVTRVGFGFKSSLTGHTYDSIEAATHYENLERRITAPQSDGQKLLDSLTTEQVKGLALAMNREVDDQNNNGIAVEETQEWLAENKHISRDNTPEGYRNSVALSIWLNERGKTAPFSRIDLDLAAQALEENGTLQIDRKLLTAQQRKRATPDVVDDDPLGPPNRFRIRG
jgi:hypothetical protein